MSEQMYTSFTVLRHERILQAITSTAMSPAGLGALFLLLVSLPFSVWVFLSQPDQPPAEYLSFFNNLSWPISIILLFPMIFGFTVKFYREIPKLVGSLNILIVETTNSQKQYDQFTRKYYHVFNNAIATYTILVLSICINLAISYQVINQGFTGWMSGGVFFSSLSNQNSGLTGVGVIAVFVQTILLYWVALFFWRGLVLTAFLREFFNTDRFEIDYQPAHKDRCCGLKNVGDCAVSVYSVLIMLGIYVLLKVFDKSFVQGISIFDDAGSAIFLAAYFLSTPLLFHFTISSSHNFLYTGKRQFFQPAEKVYRHHLGKLDDIDVENGGADAVRTAADLAESLALLRKKVPVWPFWFQFSPAITMLAPVISLAISFALVFLKHAAVILKTIYLLYVTTA